MTATPLVRNASVVDARKSLRASVRLWALVAIAGQAAFALYIAWFYGGSTITARYQRWNDVLVGGYVPGGTIGNLALGAHLLLAFVITVSGPLQLIAAIRRRAPRFHRWNGRAYVAAALAITLSGLYAVWTRGTAGGSLLRVGISLDGLLLVVCVALALGEARARRFASHRRWALRAFLLASGVWFFRVGLMFWILTAGPVGIGADFDGPFVRLWSFGCYLVPLGALQLYLWAEARPAATRGYVTAAIMTGLAIATGAGAVGAVMGMFLPHLR